MTFATSSPQQPVGFIVTDELLGCRFTFQRAPDARGYVREVREGRGKMPGVRIGIRRLTTTNAVERIAMMRSKR